MLHTTAQERYEKLKRVFARLMNRFNRDDLDDFIQTANSLPEWIERDGTLSKEQKDALRSFVVDPSLDWQICHQVANAQKHMKSNPRTKRKSNPRAKKLPTATSVVRSVHWKSGGMGFVDLSLMRVFGAGEEIVIEYDDKREPALGFVIRTFQHFHYIFEIAPIPVSQRVIPNLRDILNG